MQRRDEAPRDSSPKNGNEELIVYGGARQRKRANCEDEFAQFTPPGYPLFDPVLTLVGVVARRARVGGGLTTPPGTLVGNPLVTLVTKLARTCGRQVLRTVLLT